MLPALAASYVVSVLFHEGSLQSLSALTELNTFVLRISVASFAAYAIGQVADIQVFDSLRTIMQWWVAPMASTVLGNLLHSLVVWSITTRSSSNRFMA